MFLGRRTVHRSRWTRVRIPTYEPLAPTHAVTLLSSWWWCCAKSRVWRRDVLVVKVGVGVGVGPKPQDMPLAMGLAGWTSGRAFLGGAESSSKAKGQDTQDTVTSLEILYQVSYSRYCLHWETTPPCIASWQQVGTWSPTRFASYKQNQPPNH